MPPQNYSQLAILSKHRNTLKNLLVNYTKGGDRLNGVALTSAKVDGRKEKYSYKTVKRLVNTAGAGVASQRVSTNQSYLLNKITEDGRETHYEYRPCSL